MSIIKELTLILASCLAGEVLAKLLPIPFPSSVLAMILLFLLLLCGALKERSLAHVGDFFLQNMSLFFIPAAVGILEHFALIKSALIPFLLICFLTLLLTFAATAYTVMGVRKLQDRLSKGGKRHDR